jgi:hypothetical protein
MTQRDDQKMFSCLPFPCRLLAKKNATKAEVFGPSDAFMAREVYDAPRLVVKREKLGHGSWVKGQGSRVNKRRERTHDPPVIVLSFMTPDPGEAPSRFPKRGR